VGVSLSNNLKSPENVQKWIKTVYNDPIAKILIKNSNLTEIQLETILIDILSDYLTDKKIKTEEKAKLRIKGEISKGAFNRILKQAKKNIIRSIYTLILLQYLGLMSLTTLRKYLEVPEKIKEYIEALKNVKEEGEAEFLKNELKELLITLADHKNIRRE